MKSNLLRVLFVAVMTALSCGVASGQQFPERKHIRRGNKLYEQQRMAEAEKEYRSALQLDSMSVEGLFNLGDAQFASGAFEAAESSFKGVAERASGVTDQQRAAAYFNLGNSQFQQQKLQEALDSYKESLKLNPSDLEAKFNYAYTKALLDQNQNQDQNQNNQDQNDDQNKDQNDKNDQDQKNDDQNQDNQDQNKDRNQQGQQPKITPQAAQQMLQAIQAKEKETQDKVNKEKAKALNSRQKDKNW